MGTARWISSAIQPHIDGYESYHYTSQKPPVEADEYARVCAERDDLRRQLAECRATMADMRRAEYPPGRTAIIPPDVSGNLTLPE